MFIHELPNAVVRSALYRDGSSDVMIDAEGLDYIAATDLTASGTFNPEQVGVDELRDALIHFATAASHLNKFKKALFRMQNRAEAGLDLASGSAYPFNMGGSCYTFKAMGHDDLFHGIIGVATESGELAEVLIKLLDGERADITNVREEIGDVLWYLSRLVKWADTTFLTEMKRNIAKLRARHGQGFDKERDMNRDLGQERSTLEDK